MWVIVLKKKISKLRIQQKVLLYLLGFIGIILCLFYLAQVVFLKDFYTFIKEHDVKQATEQIKSSLQNGYDYEQIQEIASSQDFCVYTYGAETDDEPYYIAAIAGNFRACPSQPLLLDRYEQLYLKARASESGTATIIMNDKSADDGNVMRNMTSASIVNSADGNQYIFFVNTILTPVQSTISTLQTLFFVISLIVIAMAIALAYYLSRKIASPIRTTNEQAKQLALGNYEVRFDNHEYVEIDELNETLNYATRELKKVEDLRKELIANMSHDLRTPLTMISGYGEMMRDIPGENNAENVQVIIDEADRLKNLVNEILDMSKLQVGVQSLEITQFDIVSQVKQICQRIEKMLKGEFEIHLEEIDSVWIDGDEIKLMQVIYNLITNAINYSGERKEIMIHQRVENDKYYFAVQDYGVGISKEMLPYVWDRYYKGNKVHVRAKVGSGIGLSIVKGILELHKAEYGVDSEEGKGSTFWFTLNTKAFKKDNMQTRE